MTRLISLLILISSASFGQGLNRYSTLLNRFDLEGWESDTSRSFDQSGIILNNAGYHPVGISQYGLLCLNDFKLTGDSASFEKAKNQVKYYTNFMLVDSLFEGKGIGLRCEMEYKGLQPPWYSGMAQGLGISFLLRYYLISGDETILKTVGKLKYVMLQSQQSGGCLSLTDENYIWIEEYPNCPASPQVLNGFIFALFGLMDYCTVFSEDERGKSFLNECLNSLRALLPTYDSRTWTRYNKRTIYPIREFYLRVQIFQMRQLYEYTQDPFYLRQMCIWSAMGHGVTMSDTIEYIHFDEVEFCAPGIFTNGRIVPDAIDNRDLDEHEQLMIESNHVPSFPWYGFAVSNEVDVHEPKALHISVDTTKEVHILYRSSWDSEIFDMEKWQAENGVTGSDHTFQLAPGRYQFCVFYRMRDISDGLEIYSFELIDDHR